VSPYGDGPDFLSSLSLFTIAAAVLALLLGPLVGLVGGWWNLRRGNRKAALTLLSFARVVSLWMAVCVASVLLALLTGGGLSPTLIFGPPHPLHLAVAYPTLGWYFSSLLLRRLDHVRGAGPGRVVLPAEGRP
jgi:hypothetical protein